MVSDVTRQSFDKFEIVFSEKFSVLYLFILFVRLLVFSSHYKQVLNHSFGATDYLVIAAISFLTTNF